MTRPRQDLLQSQPADRGASGLPGSGDHGAIVPQEEKNP